MDLLDFWKKIKGRCENQKNFLCNIGLNWGTLYKPSSSSLNTTSMGCESSFNA